MDNKIEIKNLIKHYTSNNIVYEVLSNVNIFIKANGFYGLIGESGSGKSTFIKCLTREVTPDEGDIIINGQNIGSLNDEEWKKFKNDNITVLSQNLYLDLSNSVFNNVKMIVESRGIAFNEINYIRYLDTFGLTDKNRVKVKLLSSGEKQKILIIISILTNKKIMIFDEPTSNLDVANSQITLEYLKRMSNDRLVLVSSNNKDEVLKFCDTLLEIKNKEIYSYEMKKSPIENPLMNNEPTSKKSNPFTASLKRINYHKKQYLIYLLIVSLLSVLYLLGIGYLNDDIYKDINDSIVNIEAKNDNKDIDHFNYLNDKHLFIDISPYFDFFSNITIQSESYPNKYEDFNITSFNKKNNDIFVKGSKPRSDDEIAIYYKSNFKIGDILTYYIGSKQFDFKVVGLININYAILEKEMFEYLAFNTFLRYNEASFSPAMIYNYEIFDDNITNKEQINIYINPNHYNSQLGNEFKIKGNKLKNIVNINFDESLDSYYKISFGDDVTNNIKNLYYGNSKMTGLIKGYNDYLKLSNVLEDDYYIVYDYLNQFPEGNINISRVKEVFYFILLTLIYGILVYFIKILIFPNNLFVKEYESYYSKKANNQIHLYTCLKFLLIFCTLNTFSYTIIKNNYYIRSIYKSSINFEIYYLFFLIIPFIALYIKRSDIND